MNSNNEDRFGRFAYDLDKVYHEKNRLGIIASLATHTSGLLFNDLKALCNLTDGNLSRHLQVLHQEGLIEIIKGFSGNRPQTLCKLTEHGRQGFLEYIGVLENVITDALKAANPSTSSNQGFSRGWSPA